MMTIAQSLNRISRYLRKRGDWFDGWTNEALEDYADFHLCQGTMVVIWDNDQVAGVLSGWQQAPEQTRQWVWQENDRTGGLWYWHQIIANDPQVARFMYYIFVCRWPECVVLPSVMERHDQVRHFPPGRMMRLYRKVIGYGQS